MTLLIYSTVINFVRIVETEYYLKSTRKLKITETMKIMVVVENDPSVHTP